MGALHHRGTRRELYEVGEERRGRPRRDKVKLFFRLNPAIGEKVKQLYLRFPHLRASQSELVGLGVDLLGQQLDQMATALRREERILPAGVVDVESLYLMWNLAYPVVSDSAGTTIYLLPHQAVRLVDIRGLLRLQIRVNQSDLLNLGLALLAHQAVFPTKTAEMPAVPAGVVRTVDDLAAALSAFV